MRRSIRLIYAGRNRAVMNQILLADWLGGPGVPSCTTPDVACYSDTGLPVNSLTRGTFGMIDETVSAPTSACGFFMGPAARAASFNRQ